MLRSARIVPAEERRRPALFHVEAEQGEGLGAEGDCGQQCSLGTPLAHPEPRFPPNKWDCAEDQMSRYLGRFSRAHHANRSGGGPGGFDFCCHYTGIRMWTQQPGGLDVNPSPATY